MAEESEERTQQNAGTYHYSGPWFPWMGPEQKGDRVISFPSPLGGVCSCDCRARYPIGTFIIYDKAIQGTVISGHETGSKPIGEQW